MGWLVFDDGENAAASFLETIVGLIKMLLVPRFVSAMLGLEDDHSLSLLQVAVFLFSCGMVLYGEMNLIDKWFGPVRW